MDRIRVGLPILPGKTEDARAFQMCIESCVDLNKPPPDLRMPELVSCRNARGRRAEREAAA